MWLFVLLRRLIKKKNKNKQTAKSVDQPQSNRQQVEVMCSSFGSVLAEYEPTMQISIKKQNKKQTNKWTTIDWSLKHTE